MSSNTKKIYYNDLLPEDENKEKPVHFKGIVIPDECGKAEKYELTAILFEDEDDTSREKTKYKVYVTEEDFTNDVPFTTFEGNMDPEILLWPDDEHEDIGFCHYALAEKGYVEKTKDGENAIIISKAVSLDTEWFKAEIDISECSIDKLKEIRMTDKEVILN